MSDQTVRERKTDGDLRWLSEKTRTFKPDTKGAELVPELKVVTDNVFEKSKASALTSEMFAYYVGKGCDVKKLGDYIDGENTI